MFTWVRVKDIDLKLYKIFNTLWAYKIKLLADLTFDKLNPRWCLKGGTMDRSVYKSFSETMRTSTFRTILALKGGYYEILCDFKLDCSNAFQNTRTDDPGSKQPKMYCYPAPGFEKFDDDGERMVCELHVGMQGRIDATRLFSDKLFGLLIKHNIVRSLWDNQLCIYHIGSLVNTTASLTEVLKSFDGIEDTPPQQAPLGYAVCGWHVDDGMGVARDVLKHLNSSENRVVQYLIGSISVLFATTCTGWHGTKSLGFLIELDDKNKTVSMSAPDQLAQVNALLLKGQINVRPKHIMTDDFYDIPCGVVPEEGDPARAEVLAAMSLCRHCLGVYIWLFIAYMQAQAPTCALCSNMHLPNPTLTLKCLRHMAMHLSVTPVGIPTWGGWPCDGLETPASASDYITPFEPGKRKAMYYHYFSDSNLNTRAVQGGVGFLAGGPIQGLSQRSQLKSPDSHSAELVAAGTNLHCVIPQNGILQELRLRLGRCTPFYLDSASTVFVTNNDSAVKKSVWLVRRAAVVQEGVFFTEIVPIHIPEYNMVADPFTKYLPFAVWRRHMWYLLNELSDPPPRATKK